MPNMKSIRLKTKELQSDKVEASDFAILLFLNLVISQITTSHFFSHVKHTVLLKGHRK